MYRTLLAWLLDLRRRQLKVARTVAEREAIYRFRYDVYVEELGWNAPGTDPERRRIADVADESPTGHHLYLGTPDALEGVIRLDVFPPGQVPAELFDALAMHRFGPALDRMNVAHMSRFVIALPRRRSTAITSMTMGIWDALARDLNADLVFCVCRPGLVRHYRRLGLRPYGAALVPTNDGIQVPLVSVLSDVAYYRAMRSPAAVMVSGVFGPGRRRPIDSSSFAHLFNDQINGLVTDRQQIAEELLTWGQGGRKSTFLASLPAAAVRHVAASSFVLEVPPAMTVMLEGRFERELFLVLDGEVEILRDGQRLRLLEPGDVFGEFAFFLERGRRATTARTLGPCRLMILRRRFLDELAERDAASWRAVVFGLARVLAEREWPDVTATTAPVAERGR